MSSDTSDPSRLSSRGIVPEPGGRILPGSATKPSDVSMAAATAATLNLSASSLPGLSRRRKGGGGCGGNRLPKRAQCPRRRCGDGGRGTAEVAAAVATAKDLAAASLTSSSSRSGAPDGDLELSGPVLGPSPPRSSPSDTIRFDASRVAGPVVLPPLPSASVVKSSKKWGNNGNNDNKWQMYYYGNSGTWADGSPTAMPTGWIGLAESDDGIRWTKVRGSEYGGSVLAPTGELRDWDGIHVGVGDVVRTTEEDDNGGGATMTTLHMFYFGGGGERVSLMEGTEARPGMRMRIGRAVSVDGGRTWRRAGMVLDRDDKEGAFATMPRLMVLPQRSPSSQGRQVPAPWTMTYHSFDGRTHSVFSASSSDMGKTWTRNGRLLGPGRGGSWDEMGASSRALLHRPDGNDGWTMVYEAANREWRYCLGLAQVEEVEGGSVVCQRARGGGGSSSDSIAGEDSGGGGGPMLRPGCEPLGPWTSQLVGTPYLVRTEEGSVRLYFCSKTTETNHSIGLLISDTGRIGRGCWRALSPK